MPSPVRTGSQPENDSASVSGSDSKKRNKLGYHRTAVACGHCRRRKIRCIPSTDTSDTKCQNCIRLKKDCQFYPVDQNTTNIRKSRSDSRAEPPANEPLVSRPSKSPEEGLTTNSDSFSTPHPRRTSSSSTWRDASALLSSPSDRLGSLQTLNHSEWSHSPARDPVHCQSSRSDSHPGVTSGVYWVQNEDLPMSYPPPQQYMLATTSGAFAQESQLAYHDELNEIRHNAGRQSFSGVPTSTMDHTPNSYRHYSATFPEIERSTTLPVNMFSHPNIGDVIHTSPQLMAGPGPMIYDQVFPHQMSHSTQSWFSSTSPQAVFSSHYLPTQQERRFSHFSS